MPDRPRPRRTAGPDPAAGELRSKKSYIEFVGKTSRWTLAIGLAFVLAIGGTFVFAYRVGRQARRMRAENEPIRAWMSVPFIAHTHHVPASALFQAIGVQPREPHDWRSIRQIARDVNRPVPDLTAQLQRAINAAAHSPGGQPR